MKPFRLFTCVMALTGVLLLAACGGSSGKGGNGGGGAPADATVTMNEFAFEPGQVQVSRGQAVTLKVVNSGMVPHDFVVADMPVTDVQVQGSAENGGGDVTNASLHITLQGGSSGTITFTPTKAGEYAFFCSVSGHKDAGMLGKIIVN